MLYEPAHPAWQDPKIDDCFVKLLGDVKESWRGHHQYDKRELAKY